MKPCIIELLTYSRERFKLLHTHYQLFSPTNLLPTQHLHTLQNTTGPALHHHHTATTTYLHFCPLSLTHKHTHHTNHQAGLTHTTHTNTKPFYTCTQALHCTALHCTTLHLHTHLTLSLLISLSHSLSPTTPTTPTSTPTPSHPSIHHISYITS